ncbi:MAG: cysteine desulfurase family protein [Acidimicrobiales bacterium]
MTLAYLDHAASTPMRPEAVAAMAPFGTDVFANPTASHRSGRAARRMLDDAREQVAAALGAEPGEVVFTSGGTEADNLAVDGVVRALGGRAWCLATDHHAVLDPVLAIGGGTVAVDPTGLVDLVALAEALATGRRSSDEVAPAATGVQDLTRARRRPAPSMPGRVREATRAPLVSLALANNEVGTVQPLAELAAVVRAVAPGAVIHIDAVAAAAWLDLTIHAAVADLVSVSGHKLGGPKGIGALVVRDGCPLSPVLRGGGQERERRSGTPNVAGAVGLAAALTATVAERAATVPRVDALRRRLVGELLASIEDLVVTGDGSDPVPLDPVNGPCSLGGDPHRDRSDRASLRRGPQPLANIANVCIPGVDSEALLFLLDEEGVAASAASSCASGAMQPSHVLAAMGVPLGLVRGALRLSLGWCSTDADVDHALAVIPAAVTRLRGPARQAGPGRGGPRQAGAPGPLVVASGDPAKGAAATGADVTDADRTDVDGTDVDRTDADGTTVDSEPAPTTGGSRR